MKLRDFLKLMILALVLPLGFTACSDDDDPVPAQVESISLDVVEMPMSVGQSRQLTATIAPADLQTTLTWISSNTEVVTVDATGKVTAVGPGSAIVTVTAELGGVMAKCEVTVIVPTIWLNVDELEMKEGDSFYLAPSADGETTFTWSSSNTAVATVDAQGNVTAVGAGTAIITVTATLGGSSVTCEVTVKPEDTLLVFNGGNMYNSIDGSLSVIKYGKSQTVANHVFFNANGRSLGATVQDGIVLGDNLYIAVDGSNTIEVVNKYTFKSVTTILPTEATGEPRDIIADDNYVYVSMYTGYVIRINPQTNVIDKTVQVGPNPEEMAIMGDYLYVVNSDGLNYGANYENGKSVSKINLSSFTEEKKIEVGLNPTAMVEADDKLFVLCMGNYGDVPASLFMIDQNDNATDTGIPATFFTTDGSGLLFVVDAPWGGTPSYKAYNASDLSLQSNQFIDTPVDSPAGIAVKGTRIFVSSYNLVNGFASYTADGYVNEYDRNAGGTLVKKYDVGVGPVHMLVVD